MSAECRRKAHRRGHIAEFACAGLLLLKGYSLLARRYRNRHGEIDLIALRRGVVAFIEVKARARKEEALGAITADKRRRVAQAAQGYLASNPDFLQHGLRFDVMVVTSFWRIHHLTNAWSME